MAWRLSGNVQVAEDIVQEAFLKLWMKRDEIHIEGSVEAFCVTTVKNLFYDQQRKRRPMTADYSPEQLQIAHNESTDRTLEAKNETGIVMQLIDRLPKEQRQIMTMRDIEDMDYKEIVRQTGLTSVNVRVQLSRARKQIRQQMKEITDYGCK